jgi:outer membrane protein OmpA-like peptidoglycan-associated protein
MAYRNSSILLIFITLLGSVSGCSNPQSGPDKTIGGAILGAGWGAGAGAVVGNQVANSGDGAAVGAGVGAINGLLSGVGIDVEEGALLEQRRAIEGLQFRNEMTARELATLQYKLDRARPSSVSPVFYQVFFDEDGTSIKSGSGANLELLAESLKGAGRAPKITVAGHSDDSGTSEYNERLAEARARTVVGFLVEHGISADQIKLQNFSSTRPLVSNGSPEGRQMNRRVDVRIE